MRVIADLIFFASLKFIKEVNRTKKIEKLSKQISKKKKETSN